MQTIHVENASLKKEKKPTHVQLIPNLFWISVCTVHLDCLVQNLSLDFCFIGGFREKHERSLAVKWVELQNGICVPHVIVGLWNAIAKLQVVESSCHSGEASQLRSRPRAKKKKNCSSPHRAEFILKKDRKTFTPATAVGILSLTHMHARAWMHHLMNSCDTSCWWDSLCVVYLSQMVSLLRAKSVMQHF